MTEPMTDERLAQIRTAAAQYAGTSLIRRRPNSAITHRQELLAEMDRCHARLAELGDGQDSP